MYCEYSTARSCCLVQCENVNGIENTDERVFFFFLRERVVLYYHKILCVYETYHDYRVLYCIANGSKWQRSRVFFFFFVRRVIYNILLCYGFVELSL